MSEKLASAEIDESRQRFEKAFAAKYCTAAIADWKMVDLGTVVDLWEQAERDTRERCAQLEEEMAVVLDAYVGTCECPESMSCVRCVDANKVLDRWAVRAERIRGVNR